MENVASVAKSVLNYIRARCVVPADARVSVKSRELTKKFVIHNQSGFSTGLAGYPQF